MGNFAEAVGQDSTNYAQTDNGGLTLDSSRSNLLDFFFLAGASRNSPENAVQAFHNAFAEDEELAIRILLWTRDIRGGAGEREVARRILKSMAGRYVYDKYAEKIINNWATYGRWDDLLSLYGTAWQQPAFDCVANAIKSGDGLASKWAPRKGEVAAALRSVLGMTPKQYRKTLVNQTKVVETQMCAKDWESIEFGKLPSVASARYQTAFHRNCGEQYRSYIESLEKGEAKINAGAVYPYDVIKSLENGDERVAVAQWEALPNYIGDSGYVLPMVDVSGSMTVSVGGNTTAMDVSTSLGLYLANKQKGPFHGMYLSFSGTPSLVTLKGNLAQMYHQIKRTNVGYNTNISAAFRKVLDVAVRTNVAAKDMPKIIVIFSDMEFDDQYGIRGNSVSAFEGAREMYQRCGYELPQLVFWNLNGRPGNVPVNQHETGTALVSGFSPALMKTVLAGELSPLSVMRDTIMVDRYNIF